MRGVRRSVLPDYASLHPGYAGFLWSVTNWGRVFYRALRAVLVEKAAAVEVIHRAAVLIFQKTSDF